MMQWRAPTFCVVVTWGALQAVVEQDALFHELPRDHGVDWDEGDWDRPSADQPVTDMTRNEHKVLFTLIAE